MALSQRLLQYSFLMRFHKPEGILLLLWPTLWALWLASLGEPDIRILLIFITGVILMRGAGCVINDFADRHFDGHVERTRDRPLPKGTISTTEAVILAFFLLFFAFLLVLQCNLLTIGLAFIGAALAIVYPFLKRITFFPQLGLGLAFSWGVPMAFAAQTNAISISCWFVFLTALIWPIIYDTMYGMVDKQDDLKIGIKSTAIFFASMDKLILGLLQTLFVMMWVIVGLMFQMRSSFYFCLLAVALLFVYQQWLIKDRDPAKCFSAFLNNNLVGLAIFIGILSSYMQ